MNVKQSPSRRSRRLRPTHRATIFACLVVAILAASAAVASDFSIIDPAGGAEKRPHVLPPFTHWDLREMPGCAVPWTLSLPLADLDRDGVINAADAALAQGAFAAGFAAWDAVTPSLLNFANAGGAAAVGGFLVNGFNTISFGAPGGAGVLGATVVVQSATTGIITEADIVMNAFGAGNPRIWVFKPDGAVLDEDADNAPLGDFPGPGDDDWNGNGILERERDLLSVCTHEIGHFLGLDHNVPLGGINNDPANPLMEQFNTIGIGPRNGGWANQTLKDTDKDGENFLYCPDLGDAPDPWAGTIGQYPSLVHDPGAGRTLNTITLDGRRTGAEHILGIKQRQPLRNWTYEWLARKSAGDVDDECESNLVDRDPFDDGVTFYPNPIICGKPFTAVMWMRYANDNAGNHHDYTANKLWANAWVDLNQDGVWAPGEKMIHIARGPASPVGPNSIALTTASGLQILPRVSQKPYWFRARLDWSEDVGAAANYDGTLAQSAGAAQFGEVEDYPLSCKRRLKQHRSFNPFPTPRYFMSVVYNGDPGAQETWNASVDNNDCILSAVPFANTTYAPTADETTIQYGTPSIPVFPGQSRHTGRAKTGLDSYFTTLRAYWEPESGGAPTRVDYIPTTNADYDDYGTFVRVAVGAVNTQAGGIINGGFGTWSDSILVSVSYRVSPSLVPLPNLTPCDPYVASLPSIPAGTKWIKPDDPLTFDLTLNDAIHPGDALIVEVNSIWSVNPNQDSEITEFPAILTTTTDVGPGDVTSGAPPVRLWVTNYPNPFNPNTTIRFTLPEASTVSLRVYDVTGRLLRTLVAGEVRQAGSYNVPWNGDDDSGRVLPSGVYFYKLTAGDKTVTEKAKLVK